MHVSQPTPLISGQSSKDPQTVDPADSNAKKEPVKEKTSAYETRKQDKLKADITKIESKISSLTSLKEFGFATVENVSHLKEAARSVEKESAKTEDIDSRCSKTTETTCREKKIISELSNQSTSSASKLAKFTHPTRGRPPLEDSYPQLHRAIVDLATAGVQHF